MKLAFKLAAVQSHKIEIYIQSDSLIPIDTCLHDKCLCTDMNAFHTCWVLCKLLL